MKAYIVLNSRRKKYFKITLIPYQNYLIDVIMQKKKIK